MRMLLVAAAAGWLSGPGVLFAQAASYPTKPVRYLIPFTAGDSPDIVGRLLSERLYKLWGQTVVVENRVGAGGTVGAAVAAKAPPDGYTLFQCNIASNAIAPSLYATLPYQPRDFAPISRIATTSSALIAHPSVPTMAEAGVSGYNVTSWYGLCAPTGTPRAIIDKVNADLGTVLRAPDVLQRFGELVIDAAPTSREEFAEFIAAETSRWAKVVKAAGISQQ